MTFLNSNDSIAIFGSNGMVGSSLVRSLSAHGYCNLLTPSRKDLDLLDTSQVANWFSSKKPTVVILAAAKVGGILANNSFPADFILENLKIQNNVIECSWKNAVKRFLFLGSSCIYPKLSEQPIKEEYLLSGHLEPTNSFSVAKIGV